MTPSSDAKGHAEHTCRATRRHRVARRRCTRRHRVARKRTKPQLASKLSPLDATEWHKDGALDATEWHALPRTPANPIPNPVTVGVSRCRRTIGMSNNRGALMGR